MNNFRSAILSLRSANMPNIAKAFNTSSVESAMIKALGDELVPVFMKLVNESHMHNVPENSETHFNLVVVSEKFNGLTLVERHRLVNSIVQKALAGKFVHALSINAKTPKQWNPNFIAQPNPVCRGGFGK